MCHHIFHALHIIQWHLFYLSIPLHLIQMYIYADIIGEFSEEKTKGCVKKSKMYVFWDKESCLEQKIYGMMTKWKVRHPIMGIVLCTILGSVLLSLLTEIIIDAIIMML